MCVESVEWRDENFGGSHKIEIVEVDIADSDEVSGQISELTGAESDDRVVDVCVDVERFLDKGVGF